MKYHKLLLRLKYPINRGMCLRKKKQDENRCFWRQADRHTQDKGRGVASIFFFHIKYAGTAWDQISFRKKRRSIHGMNCQSFNFFKLLNSSLKTKTELHNCLFCAVVVCLTSFFVRRTRAHHAEFN